jgi:hypothetical protein
LKNTSIRFVFKKNIHGSVMQAQPLANFLTKNRENREYKIKISSLFKLVGSAQPIHQLPDNIMIGWISHELGHIADYERRSNADLFRLGFSYLLSKKHRIQVEANADNCAVEHGLGKYIVQTKEFVLGNAELPKAYKDKIARIYLSPDAIVEKVRKLEEKKLKSRKAP